MSDRVPCPACRELIIPGAARCPHCREAIGTKGKLLDPWENVKSCCLLPFVLTGLAVLCYYIFRGAFAD